VDLIGTISYILPVKFNGVAILLVSTFRMKAACFTGTSAFPYKTKRYQNPEDHSFNPDPMLLPHSKKEREQDKQDFNLIP